MHVRYSKRPAVLLLAPQLSFLLRRSGETGQPNRTQSAPSGHVRSHAHQEPQAGVSAQQEIATTADVCVRIRTFRRTGRARGRPPLSPVAATAWPAAPPAARLRSSQGGPSGLCRSGWARAPGALRSSPVCAAASRQPREDQGLDPA